MVPLNVLPSQTRAEILQRVVEEIQRLQEENKQLKERIAQLPQPGRSHNHDTPPGRSHEHSTIWSTDE